METMFQEMTKREKLQYAMEELSQGKNREEVAAQLGYSTYRSLDNIFRDAGYTFDKTFGNYILKAGSEQKQNLHIKVSKADEVVALFAKKKWNAKEIAEKLDFENTRALALYMTSKGYVWAADRNNYIKNASAENEAIDLGEDSVTLSTDCPQVNGFGNSGDLFQYLVDNEHILKQLIEAAKRPSEPSGIPRYGVPGIFVTKSVHMSNQLDQMVRDFSSEKNIAQRDIFEVALVHFFQQYGYEREVKALLER